MPITDDIKKTLTDPTPLYALAGAGDLAYEKLREVPGRVEALAADRKATQDKAVARLQDAQARLQQAQVKVTETVATLPTDIKTLQEKAQHFALQQVGWAAELAVKAVEVYDGLAERGKAVVEKTQAPGKTEAKDEAQTEVVEETVVEAEIVVDEPAAPAPSTGDDKPVSAEAGAPAKKTARARKSPAK